MLRRRIERHTYHAVKRAVALGNRRSAVAREYGISMESVRKIILSPNWNTWIQPKARIAQDSVQERQLADDLRMNEKYVSRTEFEDAMMVLNRRLDRHVTMISSKKDRATWPWGIR